VINFATFVIAMFVTMLLIPFLMRKAPAWHFVDVPDARKVHQHVVPRIGGIAIVIGTMIPVLLWLPRQPQSFAFIAAAMVILIFGAWDDRANLDYRVKFAGQLIAALIVTLGGDVTIRWMPFIDSYQLPYAAGVGFSIFALLGITNAMNLVDGLDGLAGGTTLLGFGAVALLSYLANDMELLLLSMAIMGAVLGFLRFNTYPASIFMGDAGSQFLGFSIGVLAILLTQKSDVGLSPMLPIVLLGLPILDTLSVMFIRIRSHRSPFAPDKNHLHHRLLARGFSHYETVVVLYVLQTLLALTACAFRYQSDLFLLAAYVLFCVPILLFLHGPASAGPVNSLRLAGLALTRTWSRRGLQWFMPERITRVVYAIFALTLPVYAVLAIANTTALSKDIAVLALFLSLFASVCFIVYRDQPIAWGERAVIYVTSALVAYLGHYLNPVAIDYSSYVFFYFVALFVLVTVGLQFNRQGTFTFTPLDILVILIAFTVLNLPILNQSIDPFPKIAVKLVILFYVVEYLITNTTAGFRYIRLANSLLLMIIAAFAML